MVATQNKHRDADISLQTVFDTPVNALNDMALQAAMEICDAHAHRAITRLYALRSEQAARFQRHIHDDLGKYREQKGHLKIDGDKQLPFLIQAPPQSLQQASLFQ